MTWSEFITMMENLNHSIVNMHPMGVRMSEDQMFMELDGFIESMKAWVWMADKDTVPEKMRSLYDALMVIEENDYSEYSEIAETFDLFADLLDELECRVYGK